MLVKLPGKRLGDSRFMTHDTRPGIDHTTRHFDVHLRITKLDADAAKLLSQIDLTAQLRGENRVDAKSLCGSQHDLYLLTVVGHLRRRARIDDLIEPRFSQFLDTLLAHLLRHSLGTGHFHDRQLFDPLDVKSGRQEYGQRGGGGAAQGPSQQQ